LGKYQLSEQEMKIVMDEIWELMQSQGKPFYDIEWIWTINWAWNLVEKLHLFPNQLRSFICHIISNLKSFQIQSPKVNEYCFEALTRLQIPEDLVKNVVDALVSISMSAHVTGAISALEKLKVPQDEQRKIFIEALFKLQPLPNSLFNKDKLEMVNSSQFSFLCRFLKSQDWNKQWDKNFKVAEFIDLCFKHKFFERTALEIIMRRVFDEQAILYLDQEEGKLHLYNHNKHYIFPKDNGHYSAYSLKSKDFEEISQTFKKELALGGSPIKGLSEIPNISGFSMLHAMHIVTGVTYVSIPSLQASSNDEDTETILTTINSSFKDRSS
jgi:hypothetical protein